MTSERWRQIENLYEAALKQEPGNRNSFLAEACQGDQELLRQVVALLEHSGAITLTETTRMREPADAEPILVAGTRLGPYQIVGSLGEGGMGRVYRALD